MKRGLPSRLVRYGLFQLAALAINFLMELPTHFIVGTPLFIWGLFFLQLPVSGLAIYPLLYGVLPRLLRRQPAAFAGLLALWLVGSLLLTALLRVNFDFVIAPRLLGGPPAHAFTWAKYLDPSGFSFFVMLTVAGAAATIELLNQWYQEQQRQEQLMQRLLASELQLLKTQLQPPFLFDALRTLRTLTAMRAAEAPAAVLHLADLLRYLLYDGPREAVPLADELAMLRDYVALEQLRLGARLEVALHVSGHVAAHRIAPLLLLPFLENAFQHGSDPATGSIWASLDMVARPDGLTVKFINGRPAEAAEAPPEGAGLRTVRQRLARLYPGRHTLRITAEPDAFVVVLHLRPEPTPTPAPVAVPASLVSSHLISAS